MAKRELITIENLGGGAVDELFQKDLARVIGNCLDPNFEAEQVRTITLQIKVKPNKDRSMCAVDVTCESKLAKKKPFMTNAFIGMDGQKPVATEYNPEQQQLFTESHGAQVRTLKAAAGGQE